EPVDAGVVVVAERAHREVGHAVAVEVADHAGAAPELVVGLDALRSVAGDRADLLAPQDLAGVLRGGERDQDRKKQGRSGQRAHDRGHEAVTASRWRDSPGAAPPLEDVYPEFAREDVASA